MEEKLLKEIENIIRNTKLPYEAKIYFPEEWQDKLTIGFVLDYYKLLDKHRLLETKGN